MPLLQTGFTPIYPKVSRVPVNNKPISNRPHLLTTVKGASPGLTTAISRFSLTRTTPEYSSISRPKVQPTKTYPRVAITSSRTTPEYTEISRGPPTRGTVKTTLPSRITPNYSQVSKTTSSSRFTPLISSGFIPSLTSLSPKITPAAIPIITAPYSNTRRIVSSFTDLPSANPPSDRVSLISQLNFSTKNLTLTTPFVNAKPTRFHLSTTSRFLC